MPHYTNDNGYDVAIHSDFLIHWTGKDIEETHNSNSWDDGIYSKTDCPALINDYIRRLKDILKYGFWMTHDTVQYEQIAEAPPVPQTCFTELKLSQARKHARQYGRLGIGVKRLYVLDRGGRPVIYYGMGDSRLNGFKDDTLHRGDPFLEACKTDLNDKALLNFFKPMQDARPLNYSLYGESEWRILGHDPKRAKAKCPKDFPEYYDRLSGTQRDKLKCLLPLDSEDLTDYKAEPWLGMIIYPSLKVKHAARADEAINKRIKEIIQKQRTEKNMWPIELDLDACRNF